VIKQETMRNQDAEGGERGAKKNKPKKLVDNLLK